MQEYVLLYTFCFSGTAFESDHVPNIDNIIEIAWLYPTFCDLLFPKFMAYSDSMALVTKLTQLLYYASVSV